MHKYYEDLRKPRPPFVAEKQIKYARAIVVHRAVK
jgi:hypothetical protein